MLTSFKSLLEKIWRPKTETTPFPEIFEQFQALLQDHQQVMELIADMGEKSGGEYIFDRKYLVDLTDDLHTLLLRMVSGLNLISANRYLGLYATLDRIFQPLEAELRGRLLLSEEMPLVIGLSDLLLDHPELTGGKANALGMILQSVSSSFGGVAPMATPTSASPPSLDCISRSRRWIWSRREAACSKASF